MNLIIRAITCCSVFFFITCSSPSSGNGSDVGNPGLCGHLEDGRYSKAAYGATVRLYTENFDHKHVILTSHSSLAVDSVQTDKNGYYIFDDVAEGIYYIQAEYIDNNDTLFMHHSSIIYSGSKDLGWDTLWLPGSIRGKISVSGEDVMGITCYIPGTSYISITDSLGSFNITSVPAGSYSLSFTSSRFNDSTLYNIKVYPDSETYIGIITLSIDRSKNEHDVWGIFDTSSDYHKVRRIEARITGDNIPVDSPRVYSLDWHPSAAGYSGFIYVPTKGTFWDVSVWVYDSIGHRIGAYTTTINTSTGDIQIPTFDPCNGIPVIDLHDTTVSLYDSIMLKPNISKLGDDSIINMAWDIGNTDNYTPTTAKDTLLIASANSMELPCVFRVIDNFGNTVMRTVFVNVIKDPPVVFAGYDTIVARNSSVDLRGRADQQFGSIVKWEWNIGSSGFKTTSSGNTTITVPDSFITAYTCILRATDDDGNSAVDTIILTVGIPTPQLISPANGDTGVSVTTHLIWNNNMSSGSVQYHLQISGVSDFSSMITNDSQITSADWNNYTFGGDSTYYWRVMAYNNKSKSNWSQVWSFATKMVLPEKPVPISPIYGDTIYSPTCTLTWAQSRGAASFHVLVLGYCDTGSPHVVVDSVLTSTSLIFTTPVITEIFYSGWCNWKVNAINALGASDTVSQMFSLPGLTHIKLPDK
ncbi:MAG TPA: hypothetical protein DCO75_12180 [Fibrobacteres bacterium]|jgi:hypothetical protein|nr:hypothetical protein [Fibrobacterota bacterium]